MVGKSGNVSPITHKSKIEKLMFSICSSAPLLQNPLLSAVLFWPFVKVKLLITIKFKIMNDLFKQLGEIFKPQKQSGFFDFPNVQTCKSNEHNPPSHIHIPQGKGFKHICPACGKETTLIPPQISF